MPFETGAAMVGGDLEGQVKGKVTQFLRRIDTCVLQLAKEKNLFTSQVKLLQPVNFCAIVSDLLVFIVASNQNTGGMPRQQFVDWSGKEMNMQVAFSLVQRDLAFEQPFGFSFRRELLDLTETEHEQEAKKIAEQYVHDEILNLERLQRIVRINPIFHGRDFLINERLIFVLAPFSEPFNTIFRDHIKPVVEQGSAFTCIRADDIYDNKPIIEDIWKSISEARIVVAELTGRNPNVFYEVGVAHTVGKEVILVTQSMDDVPFDLRHLRCIVYDYTPRGAQTLETNLKNTIDGIMRRG
jgi:hypothetical protein